MSDYSTGAQIVIYTMGVLSVCGMVFAFSMMVYYGIKGSKNL